MTNPMRKTSLLLASLCALAAFARAGDAKSGTTITVTGEVIDMVCYVDHGAQGEKHAGCAQKCIKSGLPVGLKGADGSVYLLVGEHEPLNDKLADLAAKTVTVTGKFVERDGVKMIENAAVKS